MVTLRTGFPRYGWKAAWNADTQLYPVARRSAGAQGSVAAHSGSTPGSTPGSLADERLTAALRQQNDLLRAVQGATQTAQTLFALTAPRERIGAGAASAATAATAADSSEGAGQHDALRELRQQLREAQAARAAAEEQLAQHTAALQKQEARRAERQQQEREAELEQHRAEQQQREAAEEQARAAVEQEERERARAAEEVEEQQRMAYELQESLRAERQALETLEMQKASVQEEHLRAELQARVAAEQEEQRAAQHPEVEQRTARQRAEQDGAAMPDTPTFSCRGVLGPWAMQGSFLQRCSTALPQSAAPGPCWLACWVCWLAFAPGQQWVELCHSVLGQLAFLSSHGGHARSLRSSASRSGCRLRHARPSPQDDAESRAAESKGQPVKQLSPAGGGGSVGSGSSGSSSSEQASEAEVEALQAAHEESSAHPHTCSPCVAQHPTGWGGSFNLTLRSCCCGDFTRRHSRGPDPHQVPTACFPPRARLAVKPAAQEQAEWMGSLAL